MICEYGCNNIAKHQLKNGKWCCSISYNSCSNSKNKNSQSQIGKQSGRNNPMYGKKHTEETKRKISRKAVGKLTSEKTKRKISESLKGKNNPQYGRRGNKSINWKGGYASNNIPMYDTYASQIEWCESVRRSQSDKNILEVKCAYCGKWFIPKRTGISSRINFLNNNYFGESRLYCSDSCKSECPVFNQIKWPKDFKISTSREVQPELRQLVLKRDNYKCVKCGSEKSLHCHHIEGIQWEPLESADIDICLTLCKSCHKKVHKKEGCKYNEIRCIEKEEMKWEKSQEAL